MIFQESGLTFEFASQHWIVKDFDHHPYYRILSGEGFKGVDFIGLLDKETLVCMEVKQYRQSFPESKEALLHFLHQEAEKVLQKMEDTLYVVGLIHQYYRRKRLFRLMEPIVSQYPRTYGEWGFWSKAKQLSSSPAHCKFVWFVGFSSPKTTALLYQVPDLLQLFHPHLSLCFAPIAHTLSFKVQPDTIPHQGVFDHGKEQL